MKKIYMLGILLFALWTMPVYLTCAQSRKGLEPGIINTEDEGGGEVSIEGSDSDNSKPDDANSNNTKPSDSDNDNSKPDDTGSQDSVSDITEAVTSEADAGEQDNRTEGIENTKEITEEEQSAEEEQTAEATTASNGPTTSEESILPTEDGAKDKTSSLATTEKDNKSYKIIFVAVVAIIVILLVGIICFAFGKKTGNYDKDEEGDVENPSLEILPGPVIHLTVEAMNCPVTTKEGVMSLVDELYIGTAPDSHIIPECSGVEPVHACIQRRDEDVILVNRGVESGTYIDGMRINGENILRDGDVVSVGNAEFVVRFSFEIKGE